jgi:hypothetical protein
LKRAVGRPPPDYLFGQAAATERDDHLAIAVHEGGESMKAVVYTEFGGPARATTRPPSSA